ncbi:SDR family oxidoreductase [Actinopolymorpha pittospori]|uniref:NADP-dependent 3-hydroxy acid dehydrogenase YdfG n=1 Tax=Actinopolymorpha pittospori TaxID=648752 RepID=A0A927R8T1_9ACTN|nr:SDR family oxidoreductase [Actinopolymorpha pittospori]MBE1603270.1 NADP-dependent 3-hydroxy acid dehydrogenase YdfG [Actinopolymorpha pittospori]
MSTNQLEEPPREDQKVVLVTGASSGIGAAIAARLVRQGHHVLAGARRTGRLHTLTERTTDVASHSGGSLHPVRLDVTNRSGVEAFVQIALDRFGRVDVLVNNAGVMPLSRLDSVLVEEWDRMIDVNVRGLLHGIAAVLPHFTPGVVSSELAATITDPGAAQAMRTYRAHAIEPDAVAEAVSYAVAQPADVDVDVNEIVLRPARQR